MFDTEQFIIEVESRPWLWNTKLEDYSNKIVRHESWIEIANAMFKDEWETFQEGERRCKVRLLQKKWKGLRDYFTRERNNYDKKGQMKRIPYLLNMLQFLKEIIGKKGETKDGWGSMNAPKMIRAMKRPLFPPQRRQADAGGADPNMSFLLTIVGDMKTMTESQNFEFRLEVMNLIKKIKYDPMRRSNGRRGDDKLFEVEPGSPPQDPFVKVEPDPML